MEIKITKTDSLNHISFVGTFDAASCKQARTLLGELSIEEKSSYVCSLKEVDFIDSSGLGVLVGFLKRVRAQNGFVSLIELTPSTRKLFELTQLDKVFNIHEDLSAAKAEHE